MEDFRPSLKLKEGTDVSKIDPTLRLELLAKLKNAEMKGGTRSVFAFGAAPPPPVDPIHPLVMARVVGPMPPPPPVDQAKLDKEKAERRGKGSAADPAEVLRLFGEKWNQARVLPGLRQRDPSGRRKRNDQEPVQGDPHRRKLGGSGRHAEQA